MNVMHRLMHIFSDFNVHKDVGECRKFSLYNSICKRERMIKMQNELIREEMKKLLFQSLPVAEKAQLKEDGFKFSHPTRASCILAALYKKAANGDMSAIKEILSLVSDADTIENKDEVTIIDDVNS